VAATCAACQSDMCATCVFPQEDGSVLCPACATASPIHGMGLNRGIRPPRPVVAPGTMCPNHPENPAVQRCATCRTALCATCDFALPGNLHLCANCATTPSDTVSSRRKKGTLWSYGLAILSMLLFVVGFAVPDVMGLMVLPALAGLGLGLSAVERRLRNPLWVWVPVAWNGLILGTFFLLVIVGLLMS
jgi:B-box zinc finger protein